MSTVVLLDLYDTLVCADWRALAADLASALRVSERKLLAAFETTREGRGTGRYGSLQGDIAATLTALGSPCDEALVAELEARALRFLAASIHVYDDVPRVLAALRAEGIRTAIVSNCDHATRAALTRMALPLDVDAVVLSCEARCRKPHPSIFERALAQIGAAPEDAIFVDDQAPYLDGARALGIQTFQIIRDFLYDDPPALGSHPTIRTLDELVSRLEPTVARP
jgi:putative hydrolase of the HAD superfamily